MSQTQSRDIQGRAYAKLSELCVGSLVDVDKGFDCMRGRKVVYKDKKGLYLLCSDGHHYLDGQLDDAGHLVGIYKSEP